MRDMITHSSSDLSSGEDTAYQRTDANTNEMLDTTAPDAVTIRPEQAISGAPGRPASWGERYIPPIPNSDAYVTFRRICDSIRDRLDAIEQIGFTQDTQDDILPEIAEIEGDLEALYDCNWGEGDSLKSVVVAIQSQIGNAEWTKKHFDFMRDVTQHVRSRYLINDDVVNYVNEQIKHHGLDQFRGTISNANTRHRTNGNISDTNDA